MPYYVTFEEFGKNEKRSEAVGIDQGMSLPQAIERARELINEKRNNITIRDGEGRSISGEDLYACCAGTKNLSPDLRAISG